MRIRCDVYRQLLNPRALLSLRFYYTSSLYTECSVRWCTNLYSIDIIKYPCDGIIKGSEALSEGSLQIDDPWHRTCILALGKLGVDYGQCYAYQDETKRREIILGNRFLVIVICTIADLPTSSLSTKKYRPSTYDKLEKLDSHKITLRRHVIRLGNRFSCYDYL